MHDILDRKRPILMHLTSRQQTYGNGKQTLFHDLSVFVEIHCFSRRDTVRIQ